MSERNDAALLRALDKARATTRLVICALAIAMALSLGAMVATASVMAQEDSSENNPVDQDWWPSEFGSDDQAGATNYITEEKRLDAVKLVDEGKVATLGMPYHNLVPLFPGRVFNMTIPSGGKPTHELEWPGDQFKQTFMDELLVGEIGQSGTQFDALAHPMIQVKGEEGWEDGDYFYNKNKLEDIGDPYGMKKLGPEKVGSFFTRGILIDVAASKNTDRMDKGYEITLDDVRSALDEQGIEEPKEGDVVLIRTGWNNLWRTNLQKSEQEALKDNEEFNSGEPGVGQEVCDYLADKKVAMLGMDNWGIGPYDFSETPPEEVEAWDYCHMNLTARRGIYLMENLNLKQLSEDDAHEFLFAWAPLKLVGATGSPGNPIAAY